MLLLLTVGCSPPSPGTAGDTAGDSRELRTYAYLDCGDAGGGPRSCTTPLFSQGSAAVGIYALQVDTVSAPADGGDAFRVNDDDWALGPCGPGEPCRTLPAYDVDSDD